MELVIKVYSALCALEVFMINGIEADVEDFGDSFDADPGNAPDYGCGNMSFKGKKVDVAVLAKYDITGAQYADIVDELEEKLHFGMCALCS